MPESLRCIHTALLRLLLRMSLTTPLRDVSLHHKFAASVVHAARQLRVPQSVGDGGKTRSSDPDLFKESDVTSGLTQEQSFSLPALEELVDTSRAFPDVPNVMPEMPRTSGRRLASCCTTSKNMDGGIPLRGVD